MCETVAHVSVAEEPAESLEQQLEHERFQRQMLEALLQDCEANANAAPASETARREAAERELVRLRRAVRGAMNRSGVPTNPGSTDDELTEWLETLAAPDPDRAAPRGQDGD